MNFQRQGPSLFIFYRQGINNYFRLLRVKGDIFIKLKSEGRIALISEIINTLNLRKL